MQTYIIKIFDCTTHNSADNTVRLSILLSSIDILITAIGWKLWFSPSLVIFKNGIIYEAFHPCHNRAIFFSNLSTVPSRKKFKFPRFFIQITFLIFKSHQLLLVVFVASRKIQVFTSSSFQRILKANKGSNSARHWEQKFERQKIYKNSVFFLTFRKKARMMWFFPFFLILFVLFCLRLAGRKKKSNTRFVDI